MESILLLTEQDIQDWLEFAYSYPNPTMAFDLETNSAEEAIAKVYGIGIAFEANQAFYIPYRTKAGELWWGDKSDELIEYISTILAKSKIMGHNVLYDTLVWKNNFSQDIRQNILADTILMKHMLDEERPHGLKDTAVKYLGPWADKAQQELQESVLANGGRWVAAQKDMYLADTEILGTYCCWDVLLCYKLYELFSPEIDKQGLRDLFEQEVMPLYKEVTIGMKEEGVTLDLPMFQEKKEKVIKVIDNLENEIMQDIQSLTEEFVSTWLDDEFPVKQAGNFPKAYAQVIGFSLDSVAKKVIQKLEPTNEVQENFKYWMLDECLDLEGPIRDAQMLMFHNKHPDKKYVFNLGSKHHLKWLFFDKLKETPLSFTEKKEPQVDDAFLASIVDKYPWVIKIQQLNVLNKTLGTYYEGMLERQVEGKLYTSFLQFGTTSGRFASSNPNLQNLSAPQKTGDITDEFVNSIRQGFIAKPGHMLIGSDFSSLEPHIAAYVSGDPGLIDIFVTGKDFYSAIAIKQFKLDHLSAFKEDENYLGDQDKALRNKIKTYSLAAFYGAEGPRISQVLKCPVDEADELLEGYLDAFPGIRKFIERSHYDATRKGFVKTIFGRVRHLKEVKELYESYGPKLSDWKWARSNRLLEERKIYKNLLNNAVNFQIQGTAGHVMNRAMLKTKKLLEEKGIVGKPIMQIHDEQIVQVRADQVEAAADIVKFAMETAVELDPIKLKATPIIGRSYGDCK